jgi:hypothetical protein
MLFGTINIATTLRLDKCFDGGNGELGTGNGWDRQDSGASAANLPPFSPTSPKEVT